MTFVHQTAYLAFAGMRLVREDKKYESFFLRELAEQHVTFRADLVKKASQSKRISKTDVHTLEAPASLWKAIKPNGIIKLHK